MMSFTMNKMIHGLRIHFIYASEQSLLPYSSSVCNLLLSLPDLLPLGHAYCLLFTVKGSKLYVCTVFHV